MNRKRWIFGFIGASLVLPAFTATAAISTGYLSAKSNAKSKEEFLNALSPRSRELRQLCYDARWNEMDAAYDAARAAEAMEREAVTEEDLAEVCRLYRMALHGPGESELSKKFIALVEDSINTFCSSERSNDGPAYKIAFGLLRDELHLDLIDDLAFAKCCGGRLGEALMKYAEVKISKGRKEEAVRLYKEGNFWLFFDVKKWGRIDKELSSDFRCLWERINAS